MLIVDFRICQPIGFPYMEDDLLAVTDYLKQLVSMLEQQIHRSNEGKKKLFNPLLQSINQIFSQLWASARSRWPLCPSRWNNGWVSGCSSSRRVLATTTKCHRESNCHGPCTKLSINSNSINNSSSRNRRLLRTFKKKRKKPLFN